MHKVEGTSFSQLCSWMNLDRSYFRCYTVHVVELLNYYTNHCTYIKFIKFYTLNIKTLRHVSVLGPSSGSHIVLAKVTL